MLAAEYSRGRRLLLAFSQTWIYRLVRRTLATVSDFTSLVLQTLREASAAHWLGNWTLAKSAPFNADNCHEISLLGPAMNTSRRPSFDRQSMPVRVHTSREVR